jgi:hypothetical protein
MIHAFIQKGCFQDSVSLMIISRKLSESENVDDVSVMMGTPANKALLDTTGFWHDDFNNATPNDICVAIRSEAADIKPGIEIVLNAVNLAQVVQGAALVITGEGRIDSQTAGGKAPLGVASVAKQFNVPVIGIAGVLGDGVEVVHQYGIDAVFSILPRLAPLAEVLASGETNLFNSARNIACAIKIGQGIKN